MAPHTVLSQDGVSAWTETTQQRTCDQAGVADKLDRPRISDRPGPVALSPPTPNWETTKMKIGMIAAVAIAAAATSLPLAAIARADIQAEFKSPSGNIACILFGTSLNGPELGSAVCDIRDYTWAAPPLPADCRFPHGPVLYLTQRRDNQDAATIDQCGPGNAGIYLTPGLATLDYGQTQSAARSPATLSRRG